MRSLIQIFHYSKFNTWCPLYVHYFILFHPWKNCSAIMTVYIGAISRDQNNSFNKSDVCSSTPLGVSKVCLRIFKVAGTNRKDSKED